MRRRIASILCLIVLLPIAPLSLLRWLLSMIANILVIGINLLEWATEGRAWSDALLRLCDRIERAFGVDGASESDFTTSYSGLIPPVDRVKRQMAEAIASDTEGKVRQALIDLGWTPPAHVSGPGAKQ